jgi:hypothetical protein
MYTCDRLSLNGRVEDVEILLELLARSAPPPRLYSIALVYYSVYYSVYMLTYIHTSGDCVGAACAQRAVALPIFIYVCIGELVVYEAFSY